MSVSDSLSAVGEISRGILYKIPRPKSKIRQWEKEERKITEIGKDYGIEDFINVLSDFNPYEEAIIILPGFPTYTKRTGYRKKDLEWENTGGDEIKITRTTQEEMRKLKQLPDEYIIPQLKKKIKLEVGSGKRKKRKFYRGYSIKSYDGMRRLTQWYQLILAYCFWYMKEKNLPKDFPGKEIFDVKISGSGQEADASVFSRSGRRERTIEGRKHKEYSDHFPISLKGLPIIDPEKEDYWFRWVDLRPGESTPKTHYMQTSKKHSKYYGWVFDFSHIVAKKEIDKRFDKLTPGKFCKPNKKVWFGPFLPPKKPMVELLDVLLYDTLVYDGGLHNLSQPEMNPILTWYIGVKGPEKALVNRAKEKPNPEDYISRSIKHLIERKDLIKEKI